MQALRTLWSCGILCLCSIGGKNTFQAFEGGKHHCEGVLLVGVCGKVVIWTQDQKSGASFPPLVMCRSVGQTSHSMLPTFWGDKVSTSIVVGSNNRY